MGTPNVSMQALLAEVLRSGASDLHLSVGFPPAFRRDGRLHMAAQISPLSAEDLWRYAESILSPRQLEDIRRDKDLDFSFGYTPPTGEGARFRGNCYYERSNLTMALRTITSRIRTLKQLDMPPLLTEVAQKPRGLFLATGPTGSGKSTTLAAIIQEINMNRRCHVVTVEDPIEYLFTSERAIIHQREVGFDTPSFSEALRRVLRQDPDVIMIGEMRDLETVGAAVTAAETGHLVLSTVHTPDAAQSIDRIVDVFPAHQQNQVRLQLSNILIGLCSQQLIPLPGGGRHPRSAQLHPGGESLPAQEYSSDQPGPGHAHHGSGPGPPRAGRAHRPGRGPELCLGPPRSGAPGVRHVTPGSSHVDEKRRKSVF